MSQNAKKKTRGAWVGCWPSVRVSTCTLDIMAYHSLLHISYSRLTCYDDAKALHRAHTVCVPACDSCLPTLMPTCTHACTPACLSACVPACLPARLPACQPAGLPAGMRACRHVHVPACVDPCVGTDVQTASRTMRGLGLLGTHTLSCKRGSMCTHPPASPASSAGPRASARAHARTHSCTPARMPAHTHAHMHATRTHARTHCAQQEGNTLRHRHWRTVQRHTMVPRPRNRLYQYAMTTPIRHDYAHTPWL